MKINCIVVDDEPFARKGISEYISGIDFLDLKAQCENASEANRILAREKIELIFLDIQMPGMSGIELLKSMKNSPMAILITAYPQYALDGFNLDVIDYLLKPVSQERFVKACTKARDYFNLKTIGAVGSLNENYFFVKNGNKIEKVILDEIIFIKALQNYVEIYLDDKRLITYLTFKSVEDFLPKNRFVKVQKSYIAPIARIDSIEGSELLIGKYRIPISRQYKDAALEIILKNRYLKR